MSSMPHARPFGFELPPLPLVHFLGLFAVMPEQTLFSSLFGTVAGQPHKYDDVSIFRNKMRSSGMDELWDQMTADSLQNVGRRPEYSDL